MARRDDFLQPAVLQKGLSWKDLRETFKAQLNFFLSYLICLSAI